MERYRYEDFDPEEGFDLDGAALHFGDAKSLSRLREFESFGYNSRTHNVFEHYEPHPMMRAHRKLVSELQSRLIRLTIDGEVLVFGYEDDLFEERTWIRPNRCQYLQFRFQDNKLISKAPQVEPITFVKTFMSPNHELLGVDSSPKKISPASLVQQYKIYIEGLKSRGDTSNREQDYLAMNQCFDGRVTHAQIKKLRADNTPKEWQASGRRKSGGN